jgi:hypothetical protein
LTDDVAEITQAAKRAQREFLNGTQPLPVLCRRAEAGRQTKPASKTACQSGKIDIKSLFTDVPP